MNPSDKIYVAGHRGMVGSAITRKLTIEGYENLVLKTSQELDLRDQQAVRAFFREQKPDYVFLAAARVGGILANKTYGAEFLYDNLMIEGNIIHAAYEHRVKKLMFLGSSCIYPKMAPQPLKEEYLLTGPLESSNEPYAIAKIAGIKLCAAYRREHGCHFISIMPTNLYGPNDNYDLDSSHVLPALIRKFHEARESQNPFVTIWGSGTPLREFLYADDLAEACFFLMQGYDEEEIINVGTGKDIPIRELAILVSRIVGYPGEIRHDLSKPDGTPRKLLDIQRLTDLGWQAKTGLEQGIRLAYQDFVEMGKRKKMGFLQ
jgi:GDP-L-fucose synthase